MNEIINDSGTLYRVIGAGIPVYKEHYVHDIDGQSEVVQACRGGGGADRPDVCFGVRVLVAPVGPRHLTFSDLQNLTWGDAKALPAGTTFDSLRLDAPSLAARKAQREATPGRLSCFEITERGDLTLNAYLRKPGAPGEYFFVERHPYPEGSSIRCREVGPAISAPETGEE